MAKKHPGDDGDWNLDSADPVPMTIDERLRTLIDLPSQAQRRAMEAEETFLRTVKPYTTKRFTDRRNIPGRDNLIPNGENRKGPRPI
jgi:hypothetical protein